jgi:uncharacterized protein YifN (PemK superfamily)
LQFGVLAIHNDQMAINFVPERARVLICNYDLARVSPEIDKTRRAVVISPRSYNHRHGAGPGRCLVVPFSATQPYAVTPADVPFPADKYQTLTVDTWAVCSAVMNVSHSRLDRVYVGHGHHSAELLSAEDMARIEEGLKHAMGFP